MIPDPHRRTAALVMAVLVLLWGYAWVASKIGLYHAGPFDFAALRVAIGVATLGVLLVATGRPLRPQYPKAAAAVGIVQTALFLILNTWALVDGGPGKTSILTFTMPFWVLVFAWPLLGERIQGVQWLAVGLAGAGLVAILEPWRVQTSLFSKGLAVAAGMSWAVGALMSKWHQKRVTVDPLAFTFWQMLIGLVPMALAAWTVPQKPIDWSWLFAATLLFCGAIATGIGWYLWLYVLQRLPAGTASLSSLAIPVIAAASSAIQLGERLRAAELAGMALIGAALAVMSWDMARRQRPVDPAMGQE